MSAAVPKANRLSSSNAGVEAALYPLVKAFLERQGYVVRGEVRGCDLVARRGDAAPVIVELKLRFTLPLLLQGIDRLALSPLVYLAVPRPMARTRGGEARCEAGAQIVSPPGAGPDPDRCP